LEPDDIDIFINGYVEIKNILDEHRDDKEDGDWIKYNGLMYDTFPTISEEYIKRPTRNNFNNIQKQYQEIMNCIVPQGLENTFKMIGLEGDGNKKYLTIILGWGFLYAAEEIEKEINNIPKLIFKLFVEKYYVGILNVLKIFNEHDLDKIKGYREEIKNIMVN
jgi:hypothetical protein